MYSLQRDAKIYGAVESESYITFTGFCKKINDTVQQSVNVFIDDQKVETLLANEKIADIENKYEVFDTNGFCFTYKLPKEYIGQKHKLEFKTQDGEQLLHSPTHTIDKFSPLYNQAMFIESLNQPTQYDIIKDGYTKNALSFIAIEENLNDEAFVQFVLEMCKKHKELQLSIMYFNEHQKNQVTKVLSQVKHKNFFNPTCVEELIKNSEIYLHNVVEEFRFTINEEYYNKVKNVQAIKENLFMIELTRKAKKKKEITEMVVDTVTLILFETSVISEMFKEDERYQEFVFMNSLGRVDKEKIKDMYCPNSIGFLATKENLEDEAFMGYIKELMKKFPDVEFKGFYTNLQDIKNQKDNLKFIQFIAICDIKDVIQDIEIFIFNNYKVNLEVQLFSKIRESCKNILAFHSNFSIPNYKSLTIKEVEKYWEEHLNKLINNFKRLGFEKNDISQDKSYYKSYSNVLYRKFNLGNPIISLEQSAYEYWNFKTIEYALSNKEFKEFFFNLVLGQIDIYNGNNK